MTAEGGIRRNCSFIGSEKFPGPGLSFRLGRGTGPDIKEQLPKHKEIEGGFLILHRIIDGEEWVYMQEENESRDWCDKKRGDYSTVAGTKEAGESMWHFYDRELREESGIGLDEGEFCPVPIGFFWFEDKDGGRRWVIANEMRVSEKVAESRVVGPKDGETGKPAWIRLVDLTESEAIPLRGGIAGILRAFRGGRRLVMEKASEGKHMSVFENETIYQSIKVIPIEGFS